MEFEATIPTSEQAKTMHAVERSATVTGLEEFTFKEMFRLLKLVIKPLNESKMKWETTESMPFL